MLSTYVLFVSLQCHIHVTCIFDFYLNILMKYKYITSVRIKYKVNHMTFSNLYVDAVIL